MTNPAPQPKSSPTDEASAPPVNKSGKATAFAALGLNKPLWQKLERLGYDTPSPIQAQAIPPILQGKDVMGLAQTGTGKTAAFTLPLLHNLARSGKNGANGADDGDNQYDRPIRALILSPTRELAQQIDKSVRNYGENLTTRSGCVVGGVHAHKQKKMLKNGIDVLVATPGRLEDLHSQNHVDLSQVEIVVLDEADQMLDIGFMPAIKRILALTPKSRQTLLFSATMPRQVRSLTTRYMKNPVEISVSPTSSTAENVSQSVMMVDQPKKTEALIQLLKPIKNKRVIVFSRTKRGADRIAKRLVSSRIPAVAIHGNRSQNQRTRALNDFRAGELYILVATDVAARGIDIPEVALVVNYDLPQVAENYVHRIGRTGRAGRSGEAIMFCNDEELKLLADIERVIKKNIPLRLKDGTIKPEADWSPNERRFKANLSEQANDPNQYKQVHGQSSNKKTKGRGGNSGATRDNQAGHGEKKPSRNGGQNKKPRSNPRRKPSGAQNGANSSSEGNAQNRSNTQNGENFRGRASQSGQSGRSEQSGQSGQAASGNHSGRPPKKRNRRRQKPKSGSSAQPS